MKLLLYGNCQAEAVAKALQFSNPDHQIDYAGSSNRVARFDPKRSQRLMTECDHLVAQPIMNPENPDSTEQMRERFGDRVSFMPYIFVDGLFSLVQSGNTTKYLTGIIGEKYILRELETYKAAEVVERFQQGEIDFEHKTRFAQNLVEMRRREAHCSYKVANKIADTALERPLFISHNHPRPELINHLARQIASRLSLKFTPVTREEPLKLAAITLPNAQRVISPYTTRDLDASFAYDLHWLTEGLKMIRQILDARQEKGFGGRLKDILALGGSARPGH
ncbi:MAG: WcbI family polysaccharide biosynthesis putative acetyltransferase [Pseudomonadota bacterium]